MSVVPSGTPTASANAQWTVEFEGNTSSQNIIAGGTSSGTPSATNINGTCPACGDDIIDITGGLTNELTFACLIPHSTTIKALYIDLRTAPGSGKSWKFYVRKNGSKEAASEVTISNTATTGNVTGLSISLTAGDYITIAWEGVGTPTTSSFAAGWGILLESATDGQSILAHADSSGASSTSARFWRPNEYNQGPSATETARQIIVGPTGYTLKNLYAKIITSVAAASTLVFTSRKNAADGNLTFTISTGGTSGNDTTHSDVCSEGDLIAIKTTGTGTVNAIGCIAMTQEIASATDVTVNPSVQSAAFSIPAPAIKLDFSVATAVLSLVASLIAPAVIPETKISPSVQSAIFLVQAPAIVTDQVLQASPQQAAFALQAPSISLDFTVSPAAQTATLSIQTPTVTIAQSVTASAGVQSVTFSIQALSISLGATASPAALSITASIQAPALALEYQTAVSALSATFSLQAPIVGAGVTVSATAQSVVFSVQAVSVVTDQILSPSALSAILALPAPSVAIGISFSPSAQSVTFSIQSPTVTTQTGIIVQTSVQSAVFSLISPTTKYDFSVFPTVQTFLFSIQVPTRTGSFYEDKYSNRGSSYSDKYSSRGSSFSDKYSSRGTSYSDKNSSRGTSYGDKYSGRGTSYSDKYTPKNL